MLDVCSGVGGPARYIAWKSGCQVTGLDLTASRVEGATALTEAAGMTRQVRFAQGNAMAMPFADESFTLAVSQEAFAHIPEKRQVISECARVLRPRGRLVFSDITSRAALPDADARKLFDGMRFSEIVNLVDLTDEWTRILLDRGQEPMPRRHRFRHRGRSSTPSISDRSGTGSSIGRLGRPRTPGPRAVAT